MSNGNIADYVKEAKGYQGVQIKRGDNRFCYVVRYKVAPKRISEAKIETPEQYVAANLNNWFRGKFKEAKSYRPITKIQFIDIETTGLYGTDPTWLIGTARLDTSRGLCLEMLLARDPLEEPAIMQRMMETTTRRPYWISFNGRTFDNNRMVKRAKACGVKPVDFDYLDIFQVARRVLKDRKLNRHNLGELEKINWPKFKRTNHIPSKDIPEEVLKYWHGGPAEKVWHATMHCADDLITLAALNILFMKEGH